MCYVTKMIKTYHGLGQSVHYFSCEFLQRH